MVPPVIALPGRRRRPTKSKSSKSSRTSSTHGSKSPLQQGRLVILQSVSSPVTVTAIVHDGHFILFNIYTNITSSLCLRICVHICVCVYICLVTCACGCVLLQTWSLISDCFSFLSLSLFCVKCVWMCQCLGWRMGFFFSYVVLIYVCPYSVVWRSRPVLCCSPSCAICRQHFIRPEHPHHVLWAAGPVSSRRISWFKQQPSAPAT